MKRWDLITSDEYISASIECEVSSALPIKEVRKSVTNFIIKLRDELLQGDTTPPGDVQDRAVEYVVKKYHKGPNDEWNDIFEAEMNAYLAGASSMQGENERLRAENEKLKASINEIEERENNPYWYWPQCDVDNCDGVSGCNGMYWKETGYWCLCSKHSTEGREGKPQPTMKAAAIEREKSRDGNGCLTNKQ